MGCRNFFIRFQNKRLRGGEHKFIEKLGLLMIEDRVAKNFLSFIN
jgi:hypothetical protein